jgi:glyoxylase-like metal-dependent hydrolase (beta-lactamase superfamily II)
MSAGGHAQFRLSSQRYGIVSVWLEIAPGVARPGNDPAACDASVEKLLGFEINTVYPGHGEPFAMDSFITEQGNDHKEGE